MKSRYALALAFLLAGCSDADWTELTSYPSTALANVTPASSTTAAVVADSIPGKAESKCRDSARQRAADSGAEGFDADVQQAVYEKTYESCVQWAKRMDR